MSARAATVAEATSESGQLNRCLPGFYAWSHRKPSASKPVFGLASFDFNVGLYRKTLHRNDGCGSVANGSLKLGMGQEPGPRHVGLPRIECLNLRLKYI